jgi:transcriptional regulator with XRE-family HTH domain
MDMKTRHPTLGGLLRSLRLRNRWTLKEMSQRTSIPVSTLSKIEHDRLTLTYDKLVQLSQRLNIHISELFADPMGTVEPAVTARRSIGHIEDAVRVNTKNYDYYYLCPELRQERGGVRRARAPLRRGVHLRAQRRHQGAHRIL